MYETFQSRITKFLAEREDGATFQEIKYALGIPEQKLSLALGMMVRGGLVLRRSGESPALYRLTDAKAAERAGVTFA